MGDAPEGRTTYACIVAERVGHATEDAPPVDPDAVQVAYRTHRARRRARVEHRRRVKRAGLRFWVVLVALLGAGVVLTVTLWREIQQLFGL
jgi:hypothetical protein